MYVTERRRCSICGALISDDNPDGIGFTCRKLLRKRLLNIVFSNEDFMHMYYNCDIPLLIKDTKEYIEEHSDKKHAFRNEFKKNFLNSVLGQMREKGWLSKKQREILVNYLQWRFGHPDVWMESYTDEVNKKREEILSLAMNNLSEETIEREHNTLKRLNWKENSEEIE